MFQISFVANIQLQKLIVVDNKGVIDGISNKRLLKSINPTFFNTNTRQTLTQLRQTFIKVLIFTYLNLKSDNQIKTNTLIALLVAF